jgi:hypothetical protein
MKKKNHFSSILMHTNYLLHFLVLIYMCFLHEFLLANKVQRYAIEMELFSWLYEIIRNLSKISTLLAM